jgi:class 3 adenylate cyclase
VLLALTLGAVPPQTRYARVGDEFVAYQSQGDGPVDLMFVPEWTNHVELQWEEPACARFLDRLSSFSRLVLFDKRGTGLSDPVALDKVSGLEPWMDDVHAVLDAVDARDAVIVASGAGGPMAMLYAATHPDRTRALVLCNTAARLVTSDDYPYGLSPELVPRVLAWTRDTWGTGSTFPMGAPSAAADAHSKDFHARMQRQSASPGVAVAMQEMLLGVDVRSVLPALRMPVLVLHRSDDQLVSIEHGRYLAEHIDGARFVTLPGNDHLYYAGDADALLDEIQEFVTGARGTPEPDRVLATVLFTDIVGSTDVAVNLGDARWRMLLDRHDAVVRHQLERFRGREIDTTGDGFFATFDGPARALRCACAIRDAVRGIGLEVRVGVHTGEIEVRGSNYSGIGVNIGARVGAHAAAGEVLVTRTVVDLVAGSGIQFVDRGTARLKGVPGEWQLAAVGAA